MSRQVLIMKGRQCGVSSMLQRMREAGLQQQGAYCHYMPDIPGSARVAKQQVSELIPEGAKRIEWIHTPPPWVDIRGDAVGTWAAKWFAPEPEAAAA